MKTKKASNLIVNILIIVIVIVLTGMLIAWATGMFKGKKKDLDGSTSKIDSEIGSVEEFDVQVYDGATVDGAVLVGLIEEVVDEGAELSIAVQTLVNTNRTTPVTIYYNKALNANNGIIIGGTVTALDQTNKSSDNYITPSANFKGEVLKNANKEITGIRFVQQK